MGELLAAILHFKDQKGLYIFPNTEEAVASSSTNNHINLLQH